MAAVKLTAAGVFRSGLNSLGAGREATARADSRACRRGSEALSRDQATGRARIRASRSPVRPAGADPAEARSDGEGPGAAEAAPGGRKDHRPLPTGTVLRAVFVPDLAPEEPPREPLEETFSVRVVGPDRER
jgi:hypothetical protein